jgi:type IX secretion system substrate protein
MMRAFLMVLVVTAVAGVLFPAAAQVTNLTVDHVSSNFTMVSGDSIQWSYNIPTPGGSVYGEIWYDVNSNGTIEPGTDVYKFLFTQTDGDTNGNGGPPDLDRTADGHIIFGQRVGVAPGHYILRFTYNSQSASIEGNVTALASPAHTISGHVTPPVGKSAQDINVVVHRNDQYGNNFWDAYTDASGNYTIAMDADTTGNPWGVRIENNPYPPAIIAPQDTPIVITGNHTGYNFTMLQAAAQVAGTVKDELGNPGGNNGVNLYRNNSFVFYSGRVDGNGFFQIGLTASDLTADTWQLQTNSNSFDGNTGSEMGAHRTIPAIGSGDSLFYALVVYSANSTIEGQVQLNGTPANFPLQIQASNADSGYAQSSIDTSTGNFILYVSDKIYNYDMVIPNLPFGWNPGTITAHAGQSGVIVNITIAGVMERGPGIPGAFTLRQNYPNPFNPATQIDYDLPVASRVRLTVYNILGQEVMRVVDADQHAGTYRATVDASTLPSGVYLYRLTATSSSGAGAKVYSSTKKLVVMK